MSSNTEEKLYINVKKKKKTLLHTAVTPQSLNKIIWYDMKNIYK